MNVHLSRKDRNFGLARQTCGKAAVYLKSKSNCANDKMTLILTLFGLCIRLRVLVPPQAARGKVELWRRRFIISSPPSSLPPMPQYFFLLKTEPAIASNVSIVRRKLFTSKNGLYNFKSYTIHQFLFTLSIYVIFWLF